MLSNLEWDEDARGRYLRYTLIGAAVRGEHVPRSDSELRGRLNAALAADPGETSASTRRRSGNRLIIAAGLAAGLALFAVLGFQVSGVRSLDIGERDFLAAESAPDRPIRASFPARSGAEAFAGAPAQVTGIQYLLHHTGYSSGLNRTIMQSSLVAAREDDADSASEAADID